MQIMNGRVFLIGAGPGDPGLLTLRGAELLRCSDIVLYDGLCNPEILAQAPQAEQICVGKHGKSRIWTQEEIIQEIVRHAKAGKTVSRLKGGDPAVFARTAEEIQALSDEGIPFEIVPGITAALAAGSYAGIPITHRKYASAVALVTGHEEPGKKETALDWSALASFPGTLVIYMGVTTAKHWTDNLITAGLAGKTSVAIIRRCSLPDQQILRCSLEDVPGLLGSHSEIRPPVIVIIGKVTDLQIHEVQQFAERKPLSGQTILVTRPIEQSESLAASLRDYGANVIIQPMIKISPPRDWSEMDDAIDRRKNWDLIIFCSHNGVKYFMDRLHFRKLDSRDLFGIKIGAVGSKTKNSLQQQGIHADIVPETFSGENLATCLEREAKGKNVLVIRASRGNNKLAEALKEAGASVTQVVSYQHEDVIDVDENVRMKMKEKKIDWVTAMSGETIKNLHRCFGDLLLETKIASISPVTTEIANQLGLAISAEADPYTSEDLVKAILEVVE